jgi:hypothetical protein
MCLAVAVVALRQPRRVQRRNASHGLLGLREAFAPLDAALKPTGWPESLNPSDVASLIIVFIVQSLMASAGNYLGSAEVLRARQSARLSQECELKTYWNVISSRAPENWTMEGTDFPTKVG